MYFFIALFLGSYLIVRFVLEWKRARQKKSYEEYRHIKIDEIFNRYRLDEDISDEIDRLSRKSNLKEAQGLVRDSLDAIIAADPGAVREIDSYTINLVKAKYGNINQIDCRVELAGDKSRRAGIIEYMKRREMLLHKAGKTDVLFYFVPSNYIKQDDPRRKYIGQIVFKQYYELFYPDAEYTRLW